MLRKFSREQKTHRSLDFARRDGLSLVVVGQSRCFTSDTLEDIVDERVHDAHRSAGYSNIGVDLLQDSVDESAVALFPCASLLHDLGSSFSTFAALLRACLFRAGLGWRRLTTGTHLWKKFVQTLRCELYAMQNRNDEVTTAPLFMYSVRIETSVLSRAFQIERFTLLFSIERQFRSGSKRAFTFSRAFHSNVSFDPFSKMAPIFL